MGINIKNFAAYVHGQAPAKLDGLFHAVEAKCKSLGLEPGKRDNVAGGDGNSVGGNVRGFLSFIDSVEAITEEDKTEIVSDSADEPAPTDTANQLLDKAHRREAKAQAEGERKRRLAAKQAAHADLKKAYGTLLARFASAGYKPKAVEAPLT